LFRSGFFTSDSWTINGDGFAIGNKAEGSDFLAKIMHKILGDGAAEVTTAGFQVVKKTGLTCTVKPFFVCKNGYIAWNTEDTDITFTSSASEQVFYVGVRLDLASNEYTDDSAAAYATFVSATDVASAKITITANAVTLTDGMIEDLRYDTAYCGQIDEYRERSLALIAELEDALASLIAGGVPAHAPNHHAGGSDALAPADIGAAASTHKSNHAYGGSDVLAPANIGPYGVAELDENGNVDVSQFNYEVTTHSSSFAVTADDVKYKIHRISTNAVTVTINADICAAGTTLLFPVTTGSIIFAAAAGVDLRKVGGFGSAASTALARALYLGNNVWIISGCTA